MWLETAGRADNWPKKEAEANTCTPGHSKHSRFYMEYKSKLLENSRQKQHSRFMVVVLCTGSHVAHAGHELII